MSNQNFIVTIDGPSGSGKSSLAAILARVFKAKHLNSGKIYRAVTYLILKEFFSNQPFDRSKQFDPAWLEVFNNFKINFFNEEIILSSKGLTLKEVDLSSEMVNKEVAFFSAFKEIREKVLKIQTTLATNYSLISDGRDCGSHVFPSAQVKIFLTASAESRALRVTKRLASQGESYNFEEILKSLNERDFIDKNRQFSPLTSAKDAMTLDSTTFDLDTTVKKLVPTISQKLRTMGFYF